MTGTYTNIKVFLLTNLFTFELIFALRIGHRFYHQPELNVVTNSDISQYAVLDALTKGLVALHFRLEDHGYVIPETTETVIEVKANSAEGAPVVEYHFIDHHAQMIRFWFEKDDSTSSRTVNFPDHVQESDDDNEMSSSSSSSTLVREDDPSEKVNL